MMPPQPAASLVCPQCGHPLTEFDGGTFLACRSDKLAWFRADLTTAPLALFGQHLPMWESS